jgi:hypothetical protein
LSLNLALLLSYRRYYVHCTERRFHALLSGS